MYVIKQLASDDFELAGRHRSPARSSEASPSMHDLCTRKRTNSLARSSKNCTTLGLHTCLFMHVPGSPAAPVKRVWQPIHIQANAHADPHTLTSHLADPNVTVSWPRQIRAGPNAPQPRPRAQQSCEALSRPSCHNRGAAILEDISSSHWKLNWGHGIYIQPPVGRALTTNATTTNDPAPAVTTTTGTICTTAAATVTMAAKVAPSRHG